MSETRVFECERPGQRLDRFLSDRCGDLSRSRIKRLIVNGAVTVDGSTSNAGFKLRKGQTVAIEVPDPVPTHMLPQSIPIDVLYEDDDLLVVDKPAGMAVHPGVGHPDSTLINAILGLNPDIATVGGTVRPGLVHRLDKDTSGLMVVAKTDKAHTSLTDQLKNRTVEKCYLSLVAGRLSPLEAVIDAPIARHPADRKKMSIVEDGRPSITRYRATTVFDRYTYAEARPKTGRTHQIRVHFASIGHPVVGDALYGSAHPALDRHFLHAASLAFDHPTSGERIGFKSPLPDELQSVLDSLKS